MQKENFAWCNQRPISKARQPIAWFGQPIKNATEMAIPRNTPITINRLFIYKTKIS